MRNASLLTVTMLALAASAAPAWAHAHLLRADPAAGATVKTSPTALRLTFTEGLELGFSGVAVSDAHKTTIPLGRLSLDPADPKVLIVPLAAPLAPGRYEVDWHATATDTHKTQGHYGFTVAP